MRTCVGFHFSTHNFSAVRFRIGTQFAGSRARYFCGSCFNRASQPAQQMKTLRPATMTGTGPPIEFSGNSVTGQIFWWSARVWSAGESDDFGLDFAGAAGMLGEIVDAGGGAAVGIVALRLAPK